MGKLTDAVKSMFGRGKDRVVTRDYGAQLDDWVDEGGTPHPDGPPRVVDRLPAAEVSPEEAASEQPSGDDRPDAAR